MRLVFRPAIPPGAQLTGTTLDPRKVESTLERDVDNEHVALEFTVATGTTDIAVYFKNSIVLSLPAIRVSLGQPSIGIKVASDALEGNTLRINVNVQSSISNAMQLWTERKIVKAIGVVATPLSPDQYQLKVATCNEAKQEG